MIKIPPPSYDGNLFTRNRMFKEMVLICRETWLPAYESEADFAAMMKRYFPGFNVEKLWRCGHCCKFHATGSFPINTNKSKGSKYPHKGVK